MALAMGGVMGGVIKHMLIGISGFVRLFTHFIWSPGRESVSDVPRGRLCAGLQRRANIYRRIFRAACVLLHLVLARRRNGHRETIVGDFAALSSAIGILESWLTARTLPMAATTA